MEPIQPQSPEELSPQEPARVLNDYVKGLSEENADKALLRVLIKKYGIPNDLKT